jgi:hypothetical protein
VAQALLEQYLPFKRKAGGKARGRRDTGRAQLKAAMPVKGERF